MHAPRALLMSIRPKFGWEVLGGVKKFELRRAAGPLIRTGDRVFLYFSSPVKGVVGYFEVGTVYVGTRSVLRKIASTYGQVGLTEEDWEYVDEDREGMMIQVVNPRRCTSVIGLGELRRIGLAPPMSYFVIKRREVQEILYRKCLGGTSLA